MSGPSTIVVYQDPTPTSNVWMLMTEALNNFSSTQMSDSAVVGKTLQLETNVESTVVKEGLDESNEIAQSMNTIVTQGGWWGTDSKGNPKFYTLTTQQCQDEMSYLNTEFSQVMQENNMNQSTVNSLVQGTQTAMQMDLQGLQGLLALWSTLSSAFSFFAQLLQ
ncbi:MAG: hypothetical protein KF898_03200 [Parachlamydiales bacterium]|nr:hypothetical protein [Verrucomicrobiota bacterium]MBX3718640.1 hypothetical protein [Candidatus Acheromyda pituitae]